MLSPYFQVSDDPHRRRHQTPTPSIPQPRSTVSSKVNALRMRQTNSTDYDASFDQSFDNDDSPDDFNNSFNGSNYQIPLKESKDSYETPLKIEKDEQDQLNIDLAELIKATSLPFANHCYQPMKDSFYGAERLQRPRTLAVRDSSSSSMSLSSKATPASDEGRPVIEIAEVKPIPPRRHADSEQPTSPDLLPKTQRSMSEHHEHLSPRLPPKPAHLSPNHPFPPPRSRNPSQVSLSGGDNGHRKHTPSGHRKVREF